MDKLFGGGGNQGPSAAEKAIQTERYQAASRSEAEQDQKVALASRATTLRRALAWRDENKKGALGG